MPARKGKRVAESSTPATEAASAKSAKTESSGGSNDAAPVKRGRGRPRKMKSPPKQGRNPVGRPKKSESAQTSSVKTAATEAKKSPVKTDRKSPAKAKPSGSKGRGRPRKNVEPPAEESEEGAPADTKSDSEEQ